MPKIDKLKIEADVLKGYLFFVLGIMFTTSASAIGVAFKILESDKGSIIVLVITILVFLKFSVIIFLNIRKHTKETQRVAFGN